MDFFKGQETTGIDSGMDSPSSFGFYTTVLSIAIIILILVLAFL